MSSDKTPLTELDKYFKNIHDSRPVGIEYNRGFIGRNTITYEYNINGDRAFIEKNKDGRWKGWFKEIYPSWKVIQKTKAVVLELLWRKQELG